MNGVNIRPAQAADAFDIARLFHESFPPHVAQLLIYGCKGAPEYIRRQLACDRSESAYFVAHTGTEFVGAAELRRQPNALLLNYIAVKTGHRRLRVGPTLLSNSIRMLGYCSGAIRLDVLEDNLSALRWYERLGFTPNASTEFLEISRTNPTSESVAYVAGLPQADICQERFGFSTFDLVTASGTYAIGRVGDDWFRLNNAEAAGMPEVYAALARLDPARRVFAILPPGTRPHCGATLLAKTLRMQTESGALLRALSPQ